MCRQKVCRMFLGGIEMKVSALLERLEYTCCQGSTEQEVSTVVYDSRKVQEDSLFICIRGAVVDGHKSVSYTHLTLPTT